MAEEIWPRERIVSDPGLVLAPAIKVAAVVHEPFGAYPSPVQGHYNRDHAVYADYHARSASVEGTAAWLDEWVRDVRDHAGYLAKLGRGRLDALRRRAPRLAAAVDYGC